MNYCDKINYNIYSTEKAGFEEMVDKLLAQLPRDKQIFRLAFSAHRVIMNSMFPVVYYYARRYVNIMETMSRY